ncbi:hypothetical protein JHL17_34165 [Azospirillum sp. YIM B02556]|uniref:Helix-turn-helix domain-containing protein n=1 Tax=Azospirillum endophyticum TaxID=2800326 RepID=A0ABS1FG95_9PROT|nr:hypothetical protein [Azospirillum endophyticum]MBK1842453.1 hypothetical protein [Azospirillum endophyticum]
MNDVPDDLTDGEPYAIVPAWVLEDGTLSRNARWLYAILCRHADRHGLCRRSLTRLAQQEGCTARALQKWMYELEGHGLVMKLNDRGKVGRFKVIRRKGEREEARRHNLAQAVERRIEFGEYGRIGAAAKATREPSFRGEQMQTPEQPFTGSAPSDTPTPEQPFAPPLNSGSGGPVNSGSHRTVPFEQYLLNRPRAGAGAAAGDEDRSLENAEQAREAYRRLRDRLGALRPGESWPPGRIEVHIGIGPHDRLSLVDLRKGTLPLTVAEAGWLIEAFRRMAAEMLPLVAQEQDAADRRAGLIPLEGGKAKRGPADRFAAMEEAAKQELARQRARRAMQLAKEEAEEEERAALLDRIARMIERERGVEADAAGALARLVMSCIQGHPAVVDAIARERAVPDDKLWSLAEAVIADLGGIITRRA